ncbi:MAG: SBBP repeat-containing protein, partial [Candidatus Hodarchaeota archaeon]
TAEAKSVQIPFSGFIQNVGQLDNEQIHYYYTTSKMSIGFGPSSITLCHAAFIGDSLECFSLSFPNTKLVDPVGQKKNTHYVNYFSVERHQPHIPTWDEIWYKNLYPGFDLRYYMTGQELKYDFIARADVDPSQISLQVIENMQLCIEDHCGLIKTQECHSQFQNTAVKVWQPDGLPSTAEFMLKNPSFDRYSFDLDFYNSNHILAYSTYLGGNIFDSAAGIAVDASGAAYIAGNTWSSNFPTTSEAYSTTLSGFLNSDAFISKLSPDGSTLEYSTFFGGSDWDAASGIAVDTMGAIYVTGMTDSSDFPTTPNAYDTTHNGFSGTRDAFISKLSPDGSTLKYSTYLGGRHWDTTSGIAVDASGAVYVAGDTDSADFPTTPNAYAAIYSGSRDAFVSKLSSDGSTLEFSTYIGGTNPDSVSGIAVDATGAAYVAGETKSTDFPTTSNVFDTTYSGGRAESFIFKLSSNGEILEFSTFLGGTDYDSATGGIAVDITGAIYVAGNTWSADFPTTPSAYDSFLTGVDEVFVSKLSSDGSTLEFSTFLGGSIWDTVSGIAVDASGAVYVVGMTESADFPTTPNAYNPINSGTRDAYVSKLSPDGSTLEYSTFLGGNGWDYAFEITMDVAGAFYVAGETDSSNFPTTPNAYESFKNGTSDAFVCKFLTERLPSPSLIFPNGGEVLNDTVLVQWTAVNVSLEYSVTYTLSYSPDNGTSWVVLATNLTYSSYVWDTSTVGNGEHYLLKVVANIATDLTSTDTSDSTFVVSNSILYTPPTIIIPSGGEVVSGTVFVQWTAANSTVDQEFTYAISYTSDGGKFWNVLALDQIDTTYAWDTTRVPDGLYLLKVVARFADGTLKTDISNDFFAIVNFNVTVPPNGTNTGSGSGSGPIFTISGWTWLSVLPMVVVIFLWKGFRHRKQVL